MTQEWIIDAGTGRMFPVFALTDIFTVIKTIKQNLPCHRNTSTTGRFGIEPLMLHLFFFYSVCFSKTGKLFFNFIKYALAVNNNNWQSLICTSHWKVRGGPINAVWVSLYRRGLSLDVPEVLEAAALRCHPIP